MPTKHSRREDFPCCSNLHSLSFSNQATSITIPIDKQGCYSYWLSNRWAGIEQGITCMPRYVCAMYHQTTSHLSRAYKHIPNTQLPSDFQRGQFPWYVKQTNFRSPKRRQFFVDKEFWIMSRISELPRHAKIRKKSRSDFWFAPKFNFREDFTHSKTSKRR